MEPAQERRYVQVCLYSNVERDHFFFGASKLVKTLAYRIMLLFFSLTGRFFQAQALLYRNRNLSPTPSVLSQRRDCTAKGVNRGT